MPADEEYAALGQACSEIILNMMGNQNCSGSPCNTWMTRFSSGTHPTVESTPNKPNVLITR